ncbi:hypothetical protein RUM44_009515 [Polyplax serrata]|uniref:BED-type domain-containing protein n=1 Tax=Polyplax serrata TaxID=468196 RepID=A0ABR1AUC3_POLSC
MPNPEEERNSKNLSRDSYKNPIFDYYEVIEEGKVECRICGCVMAYKKSSYLTNVARHLKRHEKYFEEYKNKKLELKTYRMRSYYSNLLIASSHIFKPEAHIDI